MTETMQLYPGLSHASMEALDAIFSLTDRMWEEDDGQCWVNLRQIISAVIERFVVETMEVIAYLIQNGNVCLLCVLCKHPDWTINTFFPTHTNRETADTIVSKLVDQIYNLCPTHKAAGSWYQLPEKLVSHYGVVNDVMVQKFFFY